MKTVLFLDSVCPRPYDNRVFSEGNCGGTELTVVMIAEALGKTGLLGVFVEQHNRTDVYDSEYVTYSNRGWVQNADYVIVLRSPLEMLEARKRFPHAKIWNWAHDLATRELGLSLPFYKETEAQHICVSNFHKTQTLGVFQPMGYTGEFKISVLYNPIPDDLQPDDTPVDYTKLVFFSSKHKGLDYTLELFQRLRSFNPEFHLEIANPGYLPDASVNLENVYVLGSLGHDEVIKRVRRALCVFYPNTIFPETFGRIFSESNAVGTPVLAHPFGAAREVLFHPSETLDCRNPRSVIDRVMAWHSGNRPKVKANPKFRLSSVIASWRKLLNV